MALQAHFGYLFRYCHCFDFEPLQGYDLIAMPVPRSVFHNKVPGYRSLVDWFRITGTCGKVLKCEPPCVAVCRCDQHQTFATTGTWEADTWVEFRALLIGCTTDAPAVHWMCPFDVVDGLGVVAATFNQARLDLIDVYSPGVVRPRQHLILKTPTKVAPELF